MPSDGVDRIRMPQAANEAGDFSTGRGDADEYAFYLGDHLGVYCGYATRDSDRQHVASGGLATALLAFALRAGVIDGVAVSKADFSQSRIGYRFDILTDPDAVQAYGTSAYFNIPIERHAGELEKFDGRIGLCVLPCHASILRSRQTAGRGLANVKLFVSLFCGHNNEPELLRLVFAKEGIKEADVADMRVERGYLSGDVVVALRDGTTRLIPFRNFNVYRSLWFHAKQMCRYCDDHLGAASDLSIGDVFVPEYRRKTIKHSALIVRTQAGAELLEQAIQAGAVTVERVDSSVVFRAQKRVLVPSHDLLSRFYACQTLRLAAKKPPVGRFRLRSYLTYTLLMANDRLSKSKAGSTLIRCVPRPLLYAYIGMIKVINTTLRPER